MNIVNIATARDIIKEKKERDLEQKISDAYLTWAGFEIDDSECDCDSNCDNCGVQEQEVQEPDSSDKQQDLELSNLKTWNKTWNQLGQELARVNNKNPYMKLIAANAFGNKKQVTYRNLHKSYNAIQKALKKDPDNFLFQMKKLEIVYDVLQIGKFESPELYDLRDNLDETVNLCDSKQPPELLLSYTQMLVDTLAVMCNTLFKAGFVERLRNWSYVEVAAREALARQDPYDLYNVSYILDCYARIGDNIERKAYLEIFEAFLDKNEKEIKTDYLEIHGADKLYPVLLDCLRKSEFDEKRIFPIAGKMINELEKCCEECQYELIDTLCIFNEQIMFRQFANLARKELILSTQSISYEQPSASLIPEPRPQSRPNLRIV